MTETDPELKQLAEEEIAAQAQRLEDLEQQLKILLLPQDPNDKRNVFLEIRAASMPTGLNQPSASPINPPGQSSNVRMNAPNIKIVPVP